LVLGFLDNPDKVALALTSKSYMAVVESARKMPVKRSTVTKFKRLAVLVRLHDWMPLGMRLYYSAVKFMPSKENGPWPGHVTFLERGLATKKAVENGPHCNSCYMRGQIEVVKATANAQRLKKMIRKM